MNYNRTIGDDITKENNWKRHIRMYGKDIILTNGRHIKTMEGNTINGGNVYKYYDTETYEEIPAIECCNKLPKQPITDGDIIHISLLFFIGCCAVGGVVEIIKLLTKIFS